MPDPITTKIKQLHYDCRGVWAIAGIVGVGVEKVKKILIAEGLTPMMRASSPWSTEEDEKLRELWGDKKHSAREIGILMDRSKNSVIGRANRLGLAEKRRGAQKMANPRKVWKQIKAKRAKPPKIPVSKVVSKVVSTKPPERPDTLTSVLSVKRGQCRFPYGDPGDEGFGLCGRPVRPESPYCEGHHKICYQKARRRTG